MASPPSSVVITSGFGEPRVVAPGEAIPLFVIGRTVERWTASDPDVVSIVPDGYHQRLVGKAPGTVTVVAVGDGFEARETFHVADLSKVRAVELVIETKGHEPNVFRLRVFALYEHFYRRDVTGEPGAAWSSSDEGVARFDAASPGTLRGVGEGSVRASVTFGGCTDEREVYVSGGVLSAIDAPVAFGTFLVGVSKWLDVGRQSTDTGWSYEGRGAVFTASPADMVEITTRDGRSVARGLRAGRVTIAARYGTLRREREVEIAERDLRLKPLRNNAAFAPKVLVVGHSVEVYAAIDADVSIDEELNIAWSSSSDELLQVVGKGSCVVATGMRPGDAKVVARFLPNGDTRELAFCVCEEPEINWY
jgi:hypothetical protein